MSTSYAKIISEQAIKGAAKAKEKGVLDQCDKMCDTCAFKWNQPHILDFFIATERAAFQLMSEGEFYCHTPDNKKSDKLCAGFVFAKMAFEN